MIRPSGEAPPPPELRRLQFAAAAFVVVVVSGVIGYQLVEGLGPLDALYMTVITITTVGFRELVEPSTAGKLLTMALIVAGVGSASYGALTAAEFVVEGHLRNYVERRRMRREIERLDGHVIVCGFGRVGRHLASQLARDGMPFVVVDTRPEIARELEELRFPHLVGDATAEHVLEEAGLARASVLVAGVTSDADNVLVTLTAKGLAPDLTVIARVKADENERKLRRAGADRVISPSTIGGRRIAQILTRPIVAEWLDGISDGGVDYTLEEIPVRPGSELDGNTLRGAELRERFGCTVVAIRPAAEADLDTHPSADRRLESGDVLVVMGSEADVTGMRDRYR